MAAKPRPRLRATLALVHSTLGRATALIQPFICYEAATRGMWFLAGIFAITTTENIVARIHNRYADAENERIKRTMEARITAEMDQLKARVRDGLL